MKKTIALLMLTVLLSGCNTTDFKATRPDGTVVEIHNSRTLWATESYSATLNTNGASLSATKSNVDSAAISAAVSGALDAALKATGK